MVFIQSQKFVDGFGKESINVVSLEGQTDYKISFNQESGKYDVVIVNGDFSKYLFSGDDEIRCVKILQGILNHHATKDAFTITDVDVFMSQEVTDEMTLDEAMGLALTVLDLCGFKNVGDMLEKKMNDDEVLTSSPNIIITSIHDDDDDNATHKTTTTTAAANDVVATVPITTAATTINKENDINYV